MKIALLVVALWLLAGASASSVLLPFKNCAPNDLVTVSEVLFTHTDVMDKVELHGSLLHPSMAVQEVTQFSMFGVHLMNSTSNLCAWSGMDCEKSGAFSAQAGLVVPSQVPSWQPLTVRMSFFVAGRTAACVEYTMPQSKSHPTSFPLVSSAAVDLTPVEQFFVGLAEGLIEGFVPDLGSCVSDVNNAYHDFEEFSHHLHMTVSDVKIALKDLVLGLAETAQALNDCGVIKVIEKVADFSAKVDSIIGDIEIATKIIIDGYDIYEDLSSAVSAWENDDYLDCGKGIGKAVALVVGDL